MEDVHAVVLAQSPVKEVHERSMRPNRLARAKAAVERMHTLSQCMSRELHGRVNRRERRGRSTT